MWRAVNSPLVHTVFYIGIIAWESVTMLLCWWAGVRLLKSYRADRAQFAAALNVAVIALTTSLLMWLVAFLDVGGEMVSDVAVAIMEWAGRGIPNVYHCRCGVFGCGATRANSRLVGHTEAIIKPNPDKTLTKSLHSCTVITPRNNTVTRSRWTSPLSAVSFAPQTVALGASHRTMLPAAG